MKKLFWFGLTGLFLFEIANVYFIMPMPGSQQMNSIDAAYFLYHWRWVFRSVFGLMIIVGLVKANWRRKWPLIFPLLIVGAVVYMANFRMAADAMFRQPKQLTLLPPASNKVDSSRLVLGVSVNGESKAYPIRFLGYHHHIQDTVGGKSVMVTYCTVCRTGRVFEPIVDGKHETFRLVGMDHFNAMLEDATTKSWWRQVTGEAVAGKLKGMKLPEVYSTQTSLAEWLRLNPNSLIMQADSASIASYDTTMKYENGESRKSLTGTDTLSWKDKSWVVGVKAGNMTKAYDWNRLKAERLIQDKIGNTPVLVVVSKDSKSFFAFERPNEQAVFTLSNDTLHLNHHLFRLDGKAVDTTFALKPLFASQEFWHSWRTFYPETLR